MARWRLFLLGCERLIGPRGETVALPDIAWPLIGSLLAAPAQRATRGWLATELWPENQDPEGARHRLGTSLWRMRSRFPDLPHLLDIAGDHIALAPEASIWVDVVAFARRAFTRKAGCSTTSLQ